MARLPRLILPGMSHHMTQRGNRRERTFFEDGDYALYLDTAGCAGVERLPPDYDEVASEWMGARPVRPDRV